MPYEAMLCHDALSRTTDGAVGREHGACVAELRASLAIRADTALDFVALGSRNAHESLSILQAARN